MKSETRLTAWQAFCLTVKPMVATGIFSLARVTTDKAGHDAWLSVLLAGAASLGAMTMIVTLMLRYPGRNLWQIAERVIGRFGAKILTLYYLLFYWFGAMVIARMYWELVDASLLHRTPVWMPMLITSVIVLYALHLGLAPIARFSEVAVAGLFMLVIFFLPLHSSLHVVDLMPIGAQGIMPILKGAPPALYSFFGFEVIIVFNDLFVGLKPRWLATACLSGVAFVTILYAVSVVSVLLTFGPYLTKKLIWPILQLLALIKLPVVNRMEGTFLMAWAVQMYSAVTVILAVTMRAAGSILGRRSSVSKFIPIIIALPILVGGWIPISLPRMMSMADWIGRLSVLSIFGIPALLLIVSFFRGKEESQ